MSTYCMYDRDEQCFEDCRGCPRAFSQPDPDDERDWRMYFEDDDEE